MALQLDFSVAASGLRQQAATASSYTTNRAQTDEINANTQRDFQRVVAQEQRTADVAREDDRLRFKREEIRATQDRQQIDQLQVRAIEDRRIQDRIDQQIADNRAADEEARFRNAQLNDTGVPFAADSQPLTPTTPQPDSFQQQLADRNFRVNQQRARENDQALQQQIDVRRSERNIQQFRTNPDAFPVDRQRGTLVDFSA